MLLFTPVCIIAGAGCSKLPKAVTQTEPVWVHTPDKLDDYAGFLTAVDSEFDKQPELALRKAKVAARQKLAERISLYVSGTVDDFFYENPQLAPQRDIALESFRRALQSEIVAYIMRQSLKEDSWKSEDRRFYVLQSVPLSVVNAALKDQGPGLSREYALFERGEIEQVFDTFSKTLDQDLKKRIAKGLVEREKPADGDLSDFFHTYPPQWVLTGASDRYPAKRYILSVGLGASISAAQKSAKDLAQRRVAALVQNMVSQLQQGSLSDQITHLPEKRLRDFPTDIFDFRVVNLWYDSSIDLHYALAVIDRNSAALKCMDAAEKQIEDWIYMYKVGINQKRAGNFAIALDNMLQAVANGETAIHYCLTAYAVSPTDLEVTGCKEQLRDISLSDTYAELNEVLEEFSILSEKGPERWAFAEENRKQLKVKVVAGDDHMPVAGVPLKFELLNMKGEFEKSKGKSLVVDSDREGIADVRLKNVERITRSDKAAIRVSMLPVAKRPDLQISQEFEAPEIKISLFIEGTSEIPLAVKILEYGEDKEMLSRQFFQDELQKQLRDRGLIVEMPEDIEVPQNLYELILKDEPAERFKELFLNAKLETPVIFVVGISEVEITDTRETSLGILNFAVCKAHIYLIRSVAEPEFVVKIQVEGISASSGESPDALVEASKDAAVIMSEKIFSYLKPH